MSVVLAHPSLNRGGGAEKVCLTVVKALVEGGYRVRLATVDRTDWRFLEKRFGNLCKPLEEICLMESMPISGAFSQAIFSSSFLPLLVYLRMRREHDLLVNTYGDLMDSIADISYINALPVRIAHLYSQSEFSSSLVWRSIAQIYNLSLKAVDRTIGGSMLLANSRFIQDVIDKSLRRRSVVVYPPVDLARFEQTFKNAHRENMVVAVSRIRPGKRLEIIPKVAKRVKRARFTIVGLADPASRDTIRLLKQAISDLGVDNRVKLLINQPFWKLADILFSSKVFLHAQPMEAFGIAVVEAMAAGCVPVVPKEGGPWSDILESKDGEYGFCYENVEEAAQKIALSMENETFRKEVAARGIKRAAAFDSSVFEGKILHIVKKLFSQRPQRFADTSPNDF